MKSCPVIVPASSSRSFLYSQTKNLFIVHQISNINEKVNLEWVHFTRQKLKLNYQFISTLSNPLMYNWQWNKLRDILPSKASYFHMNKRLTDCLNK